MTSMALIKVGSTAIPEGEIDFGTYRMRLLALSQKTITVESEDREVFEWVFGVPTENPPTDDTESDVKVNGLTSTMTGPKSKTMAFVAALLGYVPETGTELKPEDLIGKWALGTVGPNKNGYPKVDTLVAEPKTPGAKAKPAAAAASPAAEASKPKPTLAAAVEPVADAEDDLPF